MLQGKGQFWERGHVQAHCETSGLSGSSTTFCCQYCRKLLLTIANELSCWKILLLFWWSLTVTTKQSSCTCMCRKQCLNMAVPGTQLQLVGMSVNDRELAEQLCLLDYDVLFYAFNSPSDTDKWTCQVTYCTSYMDAADTSTVFYVACFCSVVSVWDSIMCIILSVKDN